jgi:hypothetical protein
VSERPSPALRSAIAQHREALAHYCEAAARTPAEAWSQPAAPGQWSADEVTAHLRLALEALAGELSGGESMRLIPSPWRARVYRWVILPRILATGRFPRARAPRETRPSGTPLPREESLARLRAAADAVDRLCAGTGARRVTHPYFGRVRVVDMLRIFARHTAHHERQVAERSTASSSR